MAFVTSLHDKGDGFHDIDLHVDGEPQVRGRARFIDRCPKEGGVLVARALRGASVAELTHLDVAAPLRGGGGGVAMMAAMGDALAARGCAYVLLDHFDNPAVKDAMGPQSDRSVRRSTDTQPFHCQPGVATSTFRKPLGRDA